MLVLAALAAGCGSKGQGNAIASECKAVGDKMVALSEARDDALLKSRPGTMSEQQRELARTQIQLVRHRMVKECEEDAWPEPVRACMLAATNTAVFDTCAAQLEAAAAPAR